MDFNRLLAQRRLILLMDLGSIVASMVLAALTHSILRDYFPVFKDPPSANQYLLIAFLAVPLMLGLVAMFDLNRQFERPFNLVQATWDQVRLHMATLVGIALVMFLTQVPLNRTIVGLFLVYTFVFMLGSRMLLDRWRRRSHAIGQDQLHLLIIGSEPSLVERLVDATLTEALPPRLVGILEHDGPQLRERILQVPILGGLDALERVLHEETIDEVVLATRGLTSAQFAGIVAACDDLGTPVRQMVLPELHDNRKLGLERQYGLPFVTLARVERTTEALAVKRGIDLIGSSAALLLLSPVMLLVAVTILITMGRPILFSQDRIGYHGRRFRMHKFRSMVNGAEQQRDALSAQNELGGPVFKISADPRVTSFGRFIRRYSLDELPQLFNVLSGAMSLVGPRPLPVQEQKQITGPLRRRLSMKPGITGLWQVTGRSDVTFEQWMQQDLEYLDNWSNLLDLKLLLLTIPAVITGRGAR